MSYEFIPERYYRMPTHFGPSLGPRQRPDGLRYSCVDSPNILSILATFEADGAQLESLLPPGFVLREPHTVNFSFEYMTNVEWLAGRGYNSFSVNVPVSYIGETESVHGDLLLVTWINKADSIVTGREELGISKIYCELPEPQFVGGNVICRASWDGFEFASLKVSDLNEISLDELPEAPQTDGTLHYKYIPKTCIPGEADAEYAVLLPASWPNVKVDQVQSSMNARMNFQEGTWQQLPTLVNIVSTLSALTLGDCVDASLLKLRGGKDLSDMRIIR